MDRKIKGVIFDLDGVLTSTSEYHYTAWKYVADKINVYFDKNINERLKGVDRMTSLKIILEKSDKQYTSKEMAKLAQEKNSYYRKLISKITPDNLYPGVKELLKEIKSYNIKVALGSASKNAMDIVKRLGIENLFDEIVDANYIKNSKPDPEVFTKAADSLNLAYDECAVVEDSQAGIIAAKKAGMIAVGIGKKENLRGADFIYPETRDIDFYETGLFM